MEYTGSGFVKIARDSDVVTMTLVGEFDMANRGVIERALRDVHPACDRVVVDDGSLGFIDTAATAELSTGVGSLLRRGIEVGLSITRPVLRRLVELVSPALLELDVAGGPATHPAGKALQARRQRTPGQSGTRTGPNARRGARTDRLRLVSVAADGDGGAR
jgi:anti-anti-sigma regulatory factor